ncbi:MAG TPA: phage baseplate assembly protein V [Pyrinomonadaceae bacterium]|nr:phage baseplate assembly protein V [Pyrinomonadaceae bacterium]
MPAEEMEELLVSLSEQVRDRFYGKYRGLVTDVEDPETMGRIVAKVPEVFEEQETPWAMPAVPFAGAGHGLVLLPEVGDGVWIEFESGDPSRPLWTGFWWGDGELPAPGAKKTRALVTTAGHQLVLDDEGSEVKLLHSGGAEMKMTGGSITLSVGGAEMKMSSTDITISLGASEIKLTPADLTLKSGGAQVKLVGAVVNINNGSITVM